MLAYEEQTEQPQDSKESEKMLSLSVKKKDILLRMSISRNITTTLRQLWDSIRISVFVIGTAAVIFAAARNSITWYLQRIWGASGSFWQNNWEYIHSMFNGNEMALTMWGTFFIVSVMFWFFNCLLMILDLTGRPQFLVKYKIQPEKNVPIDRRKLAYAILSVMLNQLITIPAMYVSYVVMKWRGCSFGPELPTFHWVLFELTVFTLVEEFMFYYSHRMLHHPLFYHRIHKKHHEWTAPVGVTSIYAHPIEHIFSNIIPVVMGPVVMGSHIATAQLWLLLAIISTTIAHCGYHFPFLPSPEAHDFHHFMFVNNYGMLGVLDRLHGTDRLFRESKAYKRHFLLLGFTPVSQQIPDNDKATKEAKESASDFNPLFT